MFGSRRPTVSVLRLTGVIGQLGPLRQGLTLASLAGLIDRAFGEKNLKAVALAISSPGGSPVQSALIHQRVRSLAREKDVPVLAFVEDVAASGGYWLACAGDEIYANESSIVGSIGVVSAGFGFVDLIEKVGITRRLYTAGERKAILDPFLPENADDVERLKSIQQDIHGSFKDLVGRRRGRRLRDAEEDLFTGEFWTGKRAQDLGLIDGLGDLRTVLRDRFGDKVRLKVMQQKRGFFRRKLGLQLGDTGGSLDRAGYSVGAGLLASVEERAMWSRFGL